MPLLEITPESDSVSTQPASMRIIPPPGAPVPLWPLSDSTLPSIWPVLPAEMKMSPAEWIELPASTVAQRSSVNVPEGGTPRLPTVMWISPDCGCASPEPSRRLEINAPRAVVEHDPVPAVPCMIMSPATVSVMLPPRPA